MVLQKMTLFVVDCGGTERRWPKVYTSDSDGQRENDHGQHERAEKPMQTSSRVGKNHSHVSGERPKIFHAVANNMGQQAVSRMYIRCGVLAGLFLHHMLVLLCK